MSMDNNDRTASAAILLTSTVVLLCRQLLMFFLFIFSNVWDVCREHMYFFYWFSSSAFFFFFIAVVVDLSTRPEKLNRTTRVPTITISLQKSNLAYVPCAATALLKERKIDADMHHLRSTRKQHSTDTRVRCNFSFFFFFSTSFSLSLFTCRLCSFSQMLLTHSLFHCHCNLLHLCAVHASSTRDRHNNFMPDLKDSKEHFYNYSKTRHEPPSFNGAKHSTIAMCTVSVCELHRDWHRSGGGSDGEDNDSSSNFIRNFCTQKTVCRFMIFQVIPMKNSNGRKYLILFAFDSQLIIENNAHKRANEKK